jgi:hypothetical protein
MNYLNINNNLAEAYSGLNTELQKRQEILEDLLIRLKEEKLSRSDLRYLEKTNKLKKLIKKLEKTILAFDELFSFTL